MIGKHLLADLYGVEPERLDDAALLARCLEAAARECRLTPVAPPALHCFPGGGITGFLLLAESHIAFHSYPEYGYLALDIFSCGTADPAAALALWRALLEPGEVRVTVEARGRRLTAHGARCAAPAAAASSERLAPPAATQEPHPTDRAP